MRIWLDLDNEADLLAINNAVHEELKAAHENGEIDNYLPAEGYTSIQKHPEKEIYSSRYDLDKVDFWSPYILRHIDESDLVEHGSEWSETEAEIDS